MTELTQKVKVAHFFWHYNGSQISHMAVIIKDSLATTHVNQNEEILLDHNDNIKIMQTIMVKLLVKFVGDQITLSLIVGIGLIFETNMKIFLKPLLLLL